MEACIADCTEVFETEDRRKTRNRKWSHCYVKSEHSGITKPPWVKGSAIEWNYFVLEVLPRSYDSAHTGSSLSDTTCACQLLNLVLKILPDFPNWQEVTTYYYLSRYSLVNILDAQRISSRFCSRKHHHIFRNFGFQPSTCTHVVYWVFTAFSFMIDWLLTFTAKSPMKDHIRVFWLVSWCFEPCQP